MPTKEDIDHRKQYRGVVKAVKKKILEKEGLDLSWQAVKQRIKRRHRGTMPYYKEALKEMKQAQREAEVQAEHVESEIRGIIEE